MIAIVDYGVGNLFSLRCSLTYIGADSAVTSDPDVISRADKVILPGVGAFGDAAEALRRTGLFDVVLREANAGKPLLGICLGMQLLYENSCEHGFHKGLGLIPGSVVSLAKSLNGRGLKVPHMGWNSLRREKEHFLLPEEGRHVYYVHSYYAEVTEHTAAWSDYGGVKITGVAVRDNIMGTQFHPEKSGDTGLEILRAFARV